MLRLFCIRLSSSFHLLRLFSQYTIVYLEHSNIHIKTQSHSIIDHVEQTFTRINERLLTPSTELYHCPTHSGHWTCNISTVIEQGVVPDVNTHIFLFTSFWICISNDNIPDIYPSSLCLNVYRGVDRLNVYTGVVQYTIQMAGSGRWGTGD